MKYSAILLATCCVSLPVFVLEDDVQTNRALMEHSSETKKKPNQAYTYHLRSSLRTIQP